MKPGENLSDRLDKWLSAIDKINSIAPDNVKAALKILHGDIKQTYLDAINGKVDIYIDHDIRELLK